MSADEVNDSAAQVNGASQGEWAFSAAPHVALKSEPEPEPGFKPEALLSADDWRLIHSYINNRALLRRKRLKPALRARLDVLLPELEQQARDRGLWIYCGGFPDYRLMQHRKPTKPATHAPADQLSELEQLLAQSIAAQEEKR